MFLDNQKRRSGMGNKSQAKSCTFGIFYTLQSAQMIACMLGTLLLASGNGKSTCKSKNWRTSQADICMEVERHKEGGRDDFDLNHREQRPRHSACLHHAQEDHNRDPAEMVQLVEKFDQLQQKLMVDKWKISLIWPYPAPAMDVKSLEMLQSHGEDSEGDPESMLPANFLNAITTRSMVKEVEKKEQAEIQPDGSQGQ
uniref:Uncharacterized protein n=1 Tax=Romanomermis culicivorax TaxID=13658 RepID=A0A915KGG9_ROMCU